MFRNKQYKALLRVKKEMDELLAVQEIIRGKVEVLSIPTVGVPVDDQIKMVQRAAMYMAEVGRELQECFELHAFHQTRELASHLGAFIPRKHREAIMGDILADANQYRSEGWTEKQIRRHIWWQFGIILIERFKGVFSWIAGAWGFKKLGGWIVKRFTVG